MLKDRMMAADIAMMKQEPVEDSDMYSELNDSITVKEEPITDYLDECSYFEKQLDPVEDPMNTNFPHFLNTFGLKIEVEDEMVAEDEGAENSYDMCSPSSFDQDMGENANYMKSELFTDSGSDQDGATTCFVDVDTLQAAHLSCAEVFSNSNPLSNEDALTMELRDLSSGLQRSQSSLRRSERRKKVKTKEDQEWLPLTLRPKVLTRMYTKVKSERVPKVKSESVPKVKSENVPKMKSENVPKMKYNTVHRMTRRQLQWMKLQKQKIELHIQEVREQKALQMREIRINLDEEQKEVSTETNIKLRNKLVKVHTTANTTKIMTRSRKDDNILKCPLCEETFSSYESQIKHVVSCVQKKPYPCCMCSMSYFGLLARALHVLSYHKGMGHRICYQCGTPFKKVSDLTNHRKVVGCKDSVKYPCNTCSEVFSDVTNQILHILAHDGCISTRNRFAQVVTKVSEVKNNKSHVGASKPGDPDPLSLDCTEQTNTKNAKKNILPDTKLIGYRCKLCCNIYQVQENLAMHQQIDHRLFLCYICNNRYHNERTWLLHMKGQHYPHLISFPCHKCGKCCSTLQDAVRHEKRHIQQDSSLAIESAVRVTRSIMESQPANEVQKYSSQKGNNIYECYVCGQAFFDKSARALHVFTHIGEKPFACSKCSKTFTVRSNLESHLTTHT